MRVRIKTWDQLVEEYGMDEYEPDVEAGFPEMLEEDIPEDRVIEIDMTKMVWIDSDGGMKWNISEDMIEEYLPDEIHFERVDPIEIFPKLITSDDELEIGKYYWCKSHFGTLSIESVDETHGLKYIGSHHWAHEGDSQALKKYTIYGPIEPPKELL